jgi:chaperone required for assembly of F1-ATPase
MRGDGEDRRPAAKVPGREPLAKPLPKRFYAAATAGRDDAGGYAVLLDGRAARTPGKRKLIVTSETLAGAMAEEWAAQTTVIDPSTMELTRLVVTALDGVVGKETEVGDDIVAFAASDLVCYRAEAPEGLVAAQNAAWDPVVAWARQRLGFRLKIAAGVVHVAQDEDGIERVRAHVRGFDALRLTALHVMTTLTGSAMIALAHADGVLDVAAAWRAAHVDEDWQIRLWGEDAEAAERRERRWRTMRAASRLLQLAG